MSAVWMGVFEKPRLLSETELQQSLFVLPGWQCVDFLGSPCENSFILLILLLSSCSFFSCLTIISYLELNSKCTFATVLRPFMYTYAWKKICFEFCFEGHNPLFQSQWPQRPTAWSLYPSTRSLSTQRTCWTFRPSRKKRRTGQWMVAKSKPV